MKTVKTRDSATTILRKIGVNSRDYGLFIKRTPDDRFEVDDAAARRKVAGEIVVDLIATKDVVVKPAEVAKSVKPPKAAPKAGYNGVDPLSSPKSEPIISRTAVVQKMLDPTKPKEKRHTISSLAEELLLAGKTNAEVWAAIKERFKLGDDKKHYPSWFRSRMRRTGKLPKKEKKS